MTYLDISSVSAKHYKDTLKAGPDELFAVTDGILREWKLKACKGATLEKLQDILTKCGLQEIVHNLNDKFNPTTSNAEEAIVNSYFTVEGSTKNNKAETWSDSDVVVMETGSIEDDPTVKDTLTLSSRTSNNGDDKLAPESDDLHNSASSSTLGDDSEEAACPKRLPPGSPPPVYNETGTSREGEATTPFLPDSNSKDDFVPRRPQKCKQSVSCTNMLILYALVISLILVAGIVYIYNMKTGENSGKHIVSGVHNLEPSTTAKSSYSVTSFTSDVSETTVLNTAQTEESDLISSTPVSTQSISSTISNTQLSGINDLSGKPVSDPLDEQANVNSIDHSAGTSQSSLVTRVPIAQFNPIFAKSSSDIWGISLYNHSFSLHIIFSKDFQWNPDDVLKPELPVKTLKVSGSVKLGVLLEILRKFPSLLEFEINNETEEICKANLSENIVLDLSVAAKLSLRFCRKLRLEKFRNCGNILETIISYINMHGLTGFRYTGDITEDDLQQISQIIRMTKQTLNEINIDVSSQNEEFSLDLDFEMKHLTSVYIQFPSQENEPLSLRSVEMGVCANYKSLKSFSLHNGFISLIQLNEFIKCENLQNVLTDVELSNHQVNLPQIVDICRFVKAKMKFYIPWDNTSFTRFGPSPREPDFCIEYSRKNELICKNIFR